MSTTTYSKKHLLLFSSFLLLYQVSTYLSNDMYVPALPTMMDYFSCTREAIEWTVAAFILGSPALILFVGPLSEKLGRKNCLLASNIIFIIFSILCTFTEDIRYLIAFRLIQGSAISCIMVAGYATVQEVFHGKEAFVIISRMVSIAVLAPTAGPVIGSFLLEYTSWKSSFYLVSLIAAIGFIGLLKYMPAQKTKQALCVAKNPISYYMSLIKLPAFLISSILAGFIVAQFYGWITLSPAMLMTHFGISVRNYGLIQIPVIGAFSLASLSVQPLLKKYQPEDLLKSGLAINLLGCLLFGVSSLARNLPPLDLITAMTFCSLGAGLVLPLLNRITVLIGTAPMDYKSALYFLLFTLVGTLSSISMSAIYTYTPLPQSFGLYIFGLGIIVLVFSKLRKNAIKRYEASMNQEEKALNEGEITIPMH